MTRHAATLSLLSNIRTMTPPLHQCQKCGRTFLNGVGEMCGKCGRQKTVPYRRRRWDQDSDGLKRKKKLLTMDPDERAAEALYVVAAEVSAACDAWFRKRGLPVGHWKDEPFVFAKYLDET